MWHCRCARRPTSPPAHQPTSPPARRSARSHAGSPPPRARRRADAPADQLLEECVAERHALHAQPGHPLQRRRRQRYQQRLLRDEPVLHQRRAQEGPAWRRAARPQGQREDAVRRQRRSPLERRVRSDRAGHDPAAGQGRRALLDVRRHGQGRPLHLLPGHDRADGEGRHLRGLLPWRDADRAREDPSGLPRLDRRDGGQRAHRRRLLGRPDLHRPLAPARHGQDVPSG